MRIGTLSCFAAVAAVVCLAAPALLAAAADDVWHASLDDGLAAAKKSGRPVLVVTLWPKGL